MPVKRFKTFQKEDFSIGYISAIAAAAGWAVSHVERDTDMVDCQVSPLDPQSEDGTLYVNVQLKATASPKFVGDDLSFSIERELWNSLRAPPPRQSLPRCLIVLYLPDECAKWTARGDDYLRFHHLARWTHLYGRSKVTDAKSKTVHLPPSRTLDADSFTQSMRDVNVAFWNQLEASA